MRTATFTPCVTYKTYTLYLLCPVDRNPSILEGLMKKEALRVVPVFTPSVAMSEGQL